MQRTSGPPMLVLSPKVNHAVLIDDDIAVKLLGVTQRVKQPDGTYADEELKGVTVSLGFAAPRCVSVDREQVRIDKEQSYQEALPDVPANLKPYAHRHTYLGGHARR